MLFNPKFICNIPPELCACDQWVNWQYETRGGKPTKVPVNPHTGRRASSTDPATWGSCDAVCKRSRVNPKLGIGFVFVPPWIGIDLDHCREGDRWSALVTHVLGHEGFRETYAEVSPSGEGLHLIVRGQLRSAVHTQKGEVYTAGRFFTVTGERVPLQPCAVKEVSGEDIDWLLGQITVVDVGAVPSVHRQGEMSGNIDTDDDALPAFVLFDALVQANPTFTATWERKRTRFKSDSEYDMANARFAVEAGWDDQNVYRLLKAWRVRHHLEVKPVALQVTIKKARETDVQTGKDALLDGVEDLPEGERKNRVTKLVGLEIVKIVQMGKDHAAYSLHLANGEVVDLGNFQESRSRVFWESVISSQTHKEVVLSVARWPKYRKLLFSLVEYVPAPETSRQAETQTWLDDYAEDAGSCPGNFEDVRQGSPFVSGSEMFVNLDMMLRHVRIRYAPGAARLALANRLVVLGWRERRIERSDEVSGKTAMRFYYVHAV